MKKITATVLTIASLMGAALALPATASAHGLMTERTVKIIKTDRYDGGHQRSREHHHKGHAHGHRPHHKKHRQQRWYGHVHQKREYRHIEPAPRPVERHRDRRDDGVRVHIDYDFRL